MSYKGISYPFRLNVRGGVATSEATPYDVAHINEGIEQLIRTCPFERTMEFHIGSRVSERLFDDINPITIGLLKADILQAVAVDNRITVTLNDIHVVGNSNSTITVYLEYYCKEFDKRFATTTLTLGEGDTI